MKALAALLLAFLAACASVPPAPGGARAESISGRLSVKVDAQDGAAARSMTAAFELQGDPRAGHLNLSTPLGSVLAQARWAPGSVQLVTPKGDRDYPDLDTLTTDMLGERLPVTAWFDWLRGRPWPGAPSAVNAAAADPGFEQLGWVVHLAEFDQAWVVATRARTPAIVVRAKLDRP